jgi:hypothetical protein
MGFGERVGRVLVGAGDRGAFGEGVEVTKGSAKRTRVSEDSPDWKEGSGSPEVGMGETDGRSELGTGLGGGTGEKPGGAPGRGPSTDMSQS